MSILDDMKEERREEVRRNLAEKGLLIGDQARVRIEPLTSERHIAGTVVRLFDIHDANVTVETKDARLVNIPESCLFSMPKTADEKGEGMKLLKRMWGNWNGRRWRKAADEFRSQGGPTAYCDLMSREGSRWERWGRGERVERPAQSLHRQAPGGSG